ncbi:fungal specific transcription factor domain containing protein [Stagonosporopsis vannaccii]|nr:fungal specific transcription factor domain containing protein [Stagonosporopsis vannaccii]
MRRPPIACQRAVQSLQHSSPQHIWVPDEALSLAIQRFFHSTCPQQKRHASNVPGPLEARRRAAKRRMTASAGFYPQDSFPTSFSLGALFGYRSQPKTSWRYEPPSLPKDAPPMDSSSNGWANDQSSKLRPQAWTTDMSSNNHNGQRSLATQDPSPTGAYGKPIDILAVAQIPWNFETTTETTPDPNNVEECLAKFKASLKPTEDGRFGPALEEAFMQSMPASFLAWKYYAAVLQHLHTLEHDPRPVLRCLLQGKGQLLQIASHVQAVDDCAKFMDQLDLMSRSPLVGRVFAVLAQSATKAERSSTESHDLLLLRLIQYNERPESYTRSESLISHTTLLYGLASKLRSRADNKLLLQRYGWTNRFRNAIVSTIRNAAQTSSGFASAEHALFCMPRPQLLALVPTITSQLAYSTKGLDSSANSARYLDSWLRMLHQVDVRANNDKALLKVAILSLAKSLHKSQLRAVIASEHFVKALLLHQDLDIQMQNTAAGPHSHRVQDLFADVLQQIQTQPKSYTALLDMALPIMAEHAGLGTLLRCVRTMEERRLALSTRVDFDPIFENKLAALSLPTANLSESQIQVRAFNLQHCEKLANALSRMGHALPARLEEIATLTGSRQFNNIMAHARANNALPIAYRDVATDLSLMERVVMVHQLAYHHSRDTTRTHREVWRFIYYLYKYLQSSSLPIGPLFTKAVVHAAITRPFLENRFVSARRLIWVCHLVARVEGDEVAAQVENRFYTWRGELIARAKRVFVGVGGSKHSKAHISTLKRLGLL